MNERDKLIQELIKEKGGTKSQYLQLLNSIAYHESAHTMDPTIKQYGGGPGRGKYQFEEGNNAGGITAARRTKKYYKDKGIKIPAWLEEATKDTSLDASKLSSDQQDILFLGNMRQHPTADFSKVWSGDESIENFWAKYHWAGLGKDKEDRLNSFRESMSKMNDSLPSSKEIKPLNYDPTIREQTIDNIQVPNYGNMQDLLNDINNINSNNENNNIPLELPYADLNNVVSTLSRSSDSVNSFNVGGTHDSNPYGGILQGIGNNGKPNTVEQGETSFELPSGKFIFSNRLNVKNSNNSNKFEEGGFIDPPTKTDVSKKFVADWFNNDITRERLSENLKNYPKAQSYINKGLRNISKVNTSYNRDLGEIDAAYNNGNIDLYGDVPKETITHELVHAMDPIDNELSNYIAKNYGTPLTALRKNTGLTDSDPLEEGISKQFNIDNSNIFGKNKIREHINHGVKIGRGGEIYPRFMEMRQFLDVKPGDVIDNTHIEKLQNDSRMKKMFNYYSPEQIKEILNTVASTGDMEYINKINLKNKSLV